jgi:glucose-6-phosphate isomerase
MLTAEDGDDVEIPGRPWTFGTLARAQALGDALALEAAGRPVVRAHLSGSLEPAIAELVRILQPAQ